MSLGHWVNRILAPFDIVVQRKSALSSLPSSEALQSADMLHGQLCYSQEGEDMILSRFFEQQHLVPGFYVDVGAHHPTRFSNTFLFYQRGWRGINIEPTPGGKTVFDRVRPGDTTLECAAGKAETLEFHVFEEGALNTFCTRKVEYICKKIPGVTFQRMPIAKVPLGVILDTYLPLGQHIDFLTIDAEECDLEVAESNNWDQYRPTVVLIENHDRNGDAGCAPIRSFMLEQNYRFAFRTVNTDFFVNNEESQG